MSRMSNLFTAGIFIVFLAILFHYFCRVRKKPDFVFQQQVQVPEGYVYPITPNIIPNNQMVGPNYGQMRSQFTSVPNVPYPVNVTMTSGMPYPYPPNTNGNNNSPYAPYPQIHIPTRPNPVARDDDLPPPYHVAVASGGEIPK